MDADIHAKIDDTEAIVDAVNDILGNIYGFSRIEVEQTAHGEPTKIEALVWGELKPRKIAVVTRLVNAAIALARTCEEADKKVRTPED